MPITAIGHSSYGRLVAPLQPRPPALRNAPTALNVVALELAQGHARLDQVDAFLRVTIVLIS